MTGHILISKWSACFPSRGVPRQWISSLRYRGFFLHPIRKAECCTLTLASTAIVRLRQSTFLPPLLAYQENAASSQDDGIEDNLWKRVQLLQRLLDLSILEEDYTQAKQFHDQLSKLRAELPEADQILLDTVGFLGKENIDERLKAIVDLGEIGDGRVVPMLIVGLLDVNSLIVSETEKALWKIFMRSGSEEVDKCLQEGLGLMLSNNLIRAKEVFGKVIDMAPSFAEGWNKRATVNYLLQDYQASIRDCKETLKLNPHHFGALSGMGLCYASLNESESALYWFEKAISIHPGLGQINKFIKMLKQKLSELNNDKDKDANKDNSEQDT